MDKTKITEFFDRLAPEWDEEPDPDEAVVSRILDNAGVNAGVSVLDVACGTGVLFPEYLKRGVSSAVGADISEKMLEVAQEKFSDPRAAFVHADAETYRFGEVFDVCVVYNALPHFPDPAALIGNLASAIKPGGRLK